MGKSLELGFDGFNAATSTLQPQLTLTLRDIPNGTFTGTLVGDFQMRGVSAGRAYNVNVTL